MSTFFVVNLSPVVVIVVTFLTWLGTVNESPDASKTFSPKYPLGPSNVSILVPVGMLAAWLTNVLISSDVKESWYCLNLDSLVLGIVIVLPCPFTKPVFWP